MVNDIGGGTGEAYGISAVIQKDCVIRNCAVSNLGATATSSPYGIMLIDPQSTIEVSRNVVTGIRSMSTASTGTVFGIFTSDNYAPVPVTVRIFDNTVTGLSSAYTGADVTTTRRIIGIGMHGSSANTTHVHEIYQNTVSISSSARLSSTCFAILNSNGPRISIRNNIFSNYSEVQNPGVRHHAMTSASTFNWGGSGSDVTNNDLHIPNDLAGSGSLVLGNATNYMTIAALQAAMPAVTGSISADPQFGNATTNVRSSSGDLNGKGVARAAYITSDQDCLSFTDNDIGAFRINACVASPCSDGDPCTINDAYNAACTCLGTYSDLDGDGLCDGNDGCPNDATKTVPGTCGCGQQEPGQSCNDGTPCTIGDVITSVCACTGTYLDSDGDGTCNAYDQCPVDPMKIEPGICGCGVPDLNTDNDALFDCEDECPTYAVPVPGFGTTPASCYDVADGTITANPSGFSPFTFAWSNFADLDMTISTSQQLTGASYGEIYVVTVTDVNGCRRSSTAPYIAVLDSDGDATVDCQDGCPNDPGKTAPGQCGCGIPEGTCQGGTSLVLAPKAMLEGPYSSASGIMSDALRSAGAIPLLEPYSALGYTYYGGGGESIQAAVLAVSGNNAIVDWVIVELRSPAAPSTIVASRAGLLQRDGDIVTVDGTSPLVFNSIPGSYHVAIRHRNHLGCMTQNTVVLSGTTTSVDFSSSALAAYGTNARKVVTGTFPTQALWAGDVTFNHIVKYTGTGNDRDPILVKVGSTTPNNSASGYWREDVNMNGTVLYTGSGNDRDPILVNVGSTTPNNVRVEQLP